MKKLTDQKKQKIKRTILNIYELLDIEDAIEITGKFIDCLEKEEEKEIQIYDLIEEFSPEELDQKQKDQLIKQFYPIQDE